MSVPTAPDDIDEIAVERAANGDRSIRLNRAEMRAAWLILERRGYSGARISATLGVATRTVSRWRAGGQPNGRRLLERQTRTSGHLACPLCGTWHLGHLRRHLRRHRQHADQLRSA